MNEAQNHNVFTNWFNELVNRLGAMELCSSGCAPWSLAGTTKPSRLTLNCSDQLDLYYELNTLIRCVAVLHPIKYVFPFTH